jgi:hydrogenase-4 component E
MNTLVDIVLVFLLLANLALLGSSRLVLCIRVAAVQGIALGLMPLLLPEHEIAFRTIFLVIGAVALKGLVFPWMLFRALRAAAVRHELEPFVGYSASLMFGVTALGVSLWLAGRLSPPTPLLSPLILPAALFTVLIGLFLIVARKKALMQVVGYLAMENGIYLFGITLAREQPLVVELGVLLDVFVAVFVMGIAIFHISREFDHIDVDQLTVLKD